MVPKIRQHITEDLATANKDDLLACQAYIWVCWEVDLISKEQMDALLVYADKIYLENIERIAGKAIA